MKKLSIQKKWLPYLALAVTAIAFGISPLLARGSIAPGPVFGFYRMGLALVILSPFFIRQRQRQVSAGFRWRYLIFPILGGLSNALDLSTWYAAVHYTKVATATLLNNTAPLWVALVASILFKEKLRPLFWVGLLVALAGSAVVIGADFLYQPELNTGNLIGLLSGVFYASYYLFTQRGRLYFGAIEYLLVMTLTSGLAMFLFSLVSGLPLSGFPLGTYLAILFAAISTQAIGFYASTYALGHLPASVVAPTLILQPVLTAVLAIPFVGETLQPGQWVGGLAVLAGIYLVNRSQEVPSPQPGTSPAD